MKGHVENETHDNFTYAKFDKDGRHFFVKISWENDLEKLNLSDDVKLIKELKESTKLK